MEVMAMSTTFWIQLLGTIFGFTMIYFTFVRFKRNELRRGEFGIMVLGWVTIISLAIAPYVLDPIIGRLNFYRRLDFFVVIGFFILLGVSFYNYSLMRKLEMKLERYVRKETLEEARKK